MPCFHALSPGGAPSLGVGRRRGGRSWCSPHGVRRSFPAVETDLPGCSRPDMHYGPEAGAEGLPGGAEELGWLACLPFSPSPTPLPTPKGKGQALGLPPLCPAPSSLRAWAPAGPQTGRGMERRRCPSHPGNPSPASPDCTPAL